MTELLDRGPLWLLVVGLLTVVGVARATRLWVFDAWPPVKWARGRFLAWAEQTRHVPAEPAKMGSLGRAGYNVLTWRAGWSPLATCPFCVAPWFALGSLGWAWWSGLEGPWGVAWLALHLWFAVSYLASMVVVRDEPEDDD